MKLRSQVASFGVWGLIDQALLSGTSFVTMFAPARVLTRDAFGAYVLAFTSLLVLNGAQGSLFTGPHNVLGGGRRGRDYVRYTASTAASQAAFAVAFALLALAVGAALTASGYRGGHLVLALAPAILAWQIQEFFRRVLYTEGRVSAALANDAISYGGQLLGIALLWRLGHMSGPTLVLVVAVTSACAAGVGAAQLRRTLALDVDLRFIRENWQFGKWLAGGNAGFWLWSSAVLYLGGAILGPSAPAALKAAQIVVAPLNVLLLFLSTILPIVFSHALRDGEAALIRRLRVTLAVTGPPLTLYCVAAAVFAAPILHALYGGKYDGYANVVRLVALYYFGDYFAQVVRDVLKARRVTRPVFTGNLAGGVVATALAPVLLVVFGVAGGALAMVLAGVILNAVLVRAFARSRPAAATPDVPLLPSREAAPLR